jgi:glucose/arabinose dehydrogenase/mono/diheme cytochrome c family protein
MDKMLALALLSMLAIMTAPGMAVAQTSGTSSLCEHAGLTLPPGFCASVFADNLGHARHLAVAADGLVYVNTWDSDYFSGAVHPGGFLIALKDSKGAGVADSVRRFGPTHESGAHGGTGIALFEGSLYAEIDDRIVRYQLPAGAEVPRGKAEVIVAGLPLGGDHPMHPFVIDSDGAMYIDVATATNACQPHNRTRHSRGLEPCVELETRGGIWRYDARRTGQVFSKTERYAMGIRNAVGLALDASGHGVYVTQHGRDQLRSNWPELYKTEEEATQPAEELLRLQPGGDYGWPECYFDVAQRKLVLAPEYGGDGGKSVGVCAQKLPPVAYFPAHWAPDDLVTYRAPQFPARYRDGIFIAFHGSWDRAPYPQGGYNVVFQPLTDGKATQGCEIFADGFAGPRVDPQHALQRPAGLAVGPDGALYVADDVHGRVYRITYTPGAAAAPDAGASGRPCPAADAPAGPIAASVDAGNAAAGNSAVPPGATVAMVALGASVFRGEVSGAGCTGCHGTDGGGSPLGPTLGPHLWLWSDGGYAGIKQTIATGVPSPKKYRSPMPAMGGAELSDDEVAAVAAYVWTLSHRKAK